MEDVRGAADRAGPLTLPRPLQVLSPAMWARLVLLFLLQLQAALGRPFLAAEPPENLLSLPGGFGRFSRLPWREKTGGEKVMDQQRVSRMQGWTGREWKDAQDRTQMGGSWA